jgi:hypothetical protein
MRGRERSGKRVKKTHKERDHTHAQRHTSAAMIEIEKTRIHETACASLKRYFGFSMAEHVYNNFDLPMRIVYKEDRPLQITMGNKTWHIRPGPKEMLMLKYANCMNLSQDTRPTTNLCDLSMSERRSWLNSNDIASIALASNPFAAGTEVMAMLDNSWSMYNHPVMRLHISKQNVLVEWSNEFY